MADVTPAFSSPAHAIDPQLEEAVRRHPFCIDLNPQSLHALLQCASLERYPANQLIFSEGSEAQSFYLVHQGQLELELFVPGSGVVLIQTVHAGEVCGVSSFFDAHRCSFSAKTSNASELIKIEATSLRDHADRDTEFGHELMARIAPVLFHRLRATRQRLIEFFGSS